MPCTVAAVWHDRTSTFCLQQDPEGNQKCLRLYLAEAEHSRQQKYTKQFEETDKISHKEFFHNIKHVHLITVV